LKIIFFTVRGLVPAVLVTIALGTAGGAAAGGVENHGCGAGTLVLSVRYRVLDDVDTGSGGANWAFDTYTRTVKARRQGGGRFCAASTYVGTFATIAGASPAGTATIPAGIRGTLRGSSTTTFKGTLAPAGRPTRGDLGTKDFACTSDDRKGECAATFDWLSTYFTSPDGFKSFRYTRYAFTYTATEGGHGTWRDVLVGGRIRTSGDIVPKKAKKK
jgi:hypothetical protein